MEILYISCLFFSQLNLLMRHFSDLSIHSEDSCISIIIMSSSLTLHKCLWEVLWFCSLLYLKFFKSALTLLLRLIFVKILNLQAQSFLQLGYRIVQSCLASFLWEQFKDTAHQVQCITLAFLFLTCHLTLRVTSQQVRALGLYVGEWRQMKTESFIAMKQSANDSTCKFTK